MCTSRGSCSTRVELQGAGGGPLPWSAAARSCASTSEVGVGWACCGCGQGLSETTAVQHLPTVGPETTSGAWLPVAYGPCGFWIWFYISRRHGLGQDTPSRRLDVGTSVSVAKPCLRCVGAGRQGRRIFIQQLLTQCTCTSRSDSGKLRVWSVWLRAKVLQSFGLESLLGDRAGYAGKGRGQHLDQRVARGGYAVEGATQGLAVAWGACPRLAQSSLCWRLEGSNRGAFRCGRHDV
mmetsp:Transcript_91365/g.295451  ORF Transcript_91365/g.295451 Transcript_91365/m.295451 type:complete len:236 (-) Transcript_91365:1601-2308(-)